MARVSKIGQEPSKGLAAYFRLTPTAADLLRLAEDMDAGAVGDPVRYGWVRVGEEIPKWLE